VYLLTVLFFFNTLATTYFSTLSLHDALPILFVWVMLPTLAYLPALMTKWQCLVISTCKLPHLPNKPSYQHLDNKELKNHPHLLRSEEHTSELQSRFDLVCRLLLEKKKKTINI